MLEDFDFQSYTKYKNNPIQIMLYEHFSWGCFYIITFQKIKV